MKKRLKQLVAITEVAYAAKQAKLAVLVREDAQLIEQLTQIDRNLNETQFDPFNGTHPAGAEIRWKAWNEREKIKINLRRAALRVQRIQMRDEVARLFGRHQAAQTLRDRSS